MAGKPLFDHSDDELRDGLRSQSSHVIYSPNDLMVELDRRAARREATAQFRLSIVGTVIAVIAVIVSAIAVVLSALRT